MIYFFFPFNDAGYYVSLCTHKRPKQKKENNNAQATNLTGQCWRCLEEVGEEEEGEREEKYFFVIAALLGGGPLK